MLYNFAQLDTVVFTVITIIVFSLKRPKLVVATIPNVC